ncbi:four-carbon acid sugar kinase family protein [Georgenia sp. TF02-10]|uniref:four-carbon acid sugar kinase family protein n=1 Tax=Georgenia sp. TF02-10 TaxID=2917725 RepID=UPI001FA80C32|nr:four-carbon acid sugar kinase family protein [Georgenia sp. TF02-10]UNX54981.1 four-carbon acid sugar kinase family protein [Georgenia sp. TF02-10]
MAHILVVADDLTGANASAAGFARAGWSAVTVSSDGYWEAIAEFHSRFDVLVATTESRHAAPEVAVRAVTGAVRAGWPVRLVSSRIDTTLRGNVGVASEALLRATRDLSGRHVVGLCMPAHPDAGRQTVEGTQLLAGVRLEETELARDVRSPVHTSSVAEVLGRGTGLRTALVPLSVVTGSRERLVTSVRDAVRSGADVVIGDAITREHLVRVAQAAAVVAAEEPSLMWAGIDPGPGSLALAQAMEVPTSGSAAPLLAVSGSATDLTRTQLQRLLSARPVRVVRPAGRGVLDVDATVARLTAELESAAGGELVLLATVLEDVDVLPLSPEQSAQLPRALGRITRRALQERRVDGLYTTGGDVTAAVLAEIGGRGIEVEGEVVPLAVAGEVVDGPWDGMPIVTKGGLIGGPMAAVECLDHLARVAGQRNRWVRAAVPRERL